MSFHEITYNSSKILYRPSRPLCIKTVGGRMPSLMITDFGGLKTWPDDIHYYFLVPRVPSHSHLVILGGAIIITLVDFLTMFLQNAFPSLTSMQFSTNNYHIYIHPIHKRNWKTTWILRNLGFITKLSCLVMTFTIIKRDRYVYLYLSTV